MGIIDAFGAEDRVQVTFSEFKALVKAEAELELMKKAMMKCVDPEIIQKIFIEEFDELDELKKYRSTKLKPEQLFEMDRLYTENCKEIAKMEKDIAARDQEIAELEGTIKKLKGRAEATPDSLIESDESFDEENPFT